MPPERTPASDSPPPHLKVGALARMTGLTVRALHHYEEVGLLAPADRTRAGHRLYGTAQVRRLHQITSLRQLGLSLDEIARLLDDPAQTLEATLDRQLEGLRERIREEEALCRQLESLRSRLADGAEGVTVEELTRSLNQTVRIESHFSPDQLERLKARRDALGDEGMARGQADWAEVMAAFEAAMDEGLPPDHPRVAVLARRASELVEAFTGGDASIRDSLARMYADEGPDRVMGTHGVPLRPGLWEYMGRARTLLDS
ncbi:MAG: MerR family transcriptional regulator [Gemmatimonadota bacterium]